ncbi:hypothetical protein [Tersicoccus phoenicis]|uniref:hypothetical protein n=1 Tax=Tersicoccus phoenicis TaxID=554083 RepID=UPI00117F70D2|nr:hypothetical protein [Tersicoccus phoenicis]
MAFAKVLSTHKMTFPDGTGALDLSKYLDEFETADEATAAVEDEWRGHAHMVPGTLPASWRD